MALNPGSNTNWNCTKPDKEGYSLELFGTVVSIQEVQAREYTMSGQPGRPRFWPEGNPVWNIRMGFAMPDGSLKSITFPEAGAKQRSGEKPSLHMQMYNLSNGNMNNLIGKTLHVWTWPANPETGQQWRQGNPRLFGVEDVSDQITYELAGPLPYEFTIEQLLCNDGAQGGQPTPSAPQQIQAPTVPQPQMQGQFYAAPQAQPMQQQVPPQQYVAPQQQVPQQQYAAPHPQVLHQQAPAVQQSMPAMQAMPPQQTQAAPMPQGMDPAVAQAMQAVGAVNVQPVDETGGVYDQDIPL